MLLRLFPSISPPLSLTTGFRYIRPRASYRLYRGSREMGEQENSESEVIQVKNRATFRLCNVSSFTTEVLEIPADNPTLHVLVIPGNPGIVSFYKDFVESLYELLGGAASVTAVGHISHTKKNWEHGRLFSLQEQIDHKMDFIKQELQNNEVPILLVGHSIGSYISLEMFKRSPEKVTFCVGLYPFLALNRQSIQQSFIRKLAAELLLTPKSTLLQVEFLVYVFRSRITSVVLSLIVALLGLFPIRLLRLIVTTFLGKLWSATAVEATCSHLVKYHTMRNVLFMAMTEFKKLSETPDWAFMREKQHKMAFLFGVDDHWGPLQMLEEISKQVPDAVLSIEREGHTHAFCCTEAGSMWVAEHVAGLIKNNQAS
nr:lipid droplet-associated hydrolase-like isoform X1 [Malus domestica]